MAFNDLFPRFRYDSTGVRERNDTLAMGNLQQFGAMCCLMAYVGTISTVHRRIVEACLLGDVIWMAVFLNLVRKG